MEYQHEDGRISATDADGRVIAEILFPEGEDGVVDIVRTFVDDSLRGQGTAGELMSLAYDDIKASGRSTRASCSYAAAWFTKHQDKRDILA